MLTKRLFEEKRPTFSFEIFPPKNTTSIDSIYQTIDALAPLQPHFISVTYGAGGSSRQNTVAIASAIREQYNIEALAHLTCVGAKKDTIDQILEELDAKGVNNILALRGDLPEGEKSLGDFRYATELVQYIKEKDKFFIGAACYPEKHMEAFHLEEDLRHLQEKVGVGTDVLISQLFFDNTVFYSWEKRVRQLGIQTPIVAGIMPITSSSQLNRLVSLCGATISPEIQRLVKAYQHNAFALKEAGIAHATMQIIDLLAYGVEGIHLYTMNQADVAIRIMNNVRGAFYALGVKRG